MPFPFAETLSLTDSQGSQLEPLVRARSTQALVFRCRLTLRATDQANPTNLQIAAELHCERHAVALWRNHYLLIGWPAGRAAVGTTATLFPRRNGSM